MDNTNIFNNFFDSKFLEALADMVAERVATKIQAKMKREKEAYSGKEVAKRVGLEYCQFRKNFREGMYRDFITQYGSKYFVDETQFAAIKQKQRC